MIQKCCIIPSLQKIYFGSNNTNFILASIKKKERVLEEMKQIQRYPQNIRCRVVQCAHQIVGKNETNICCIMWGKW
jgi:hypothetical protein